jgi:hypothetical protein
VTTERKGLRPRARNLWPGGRGGVAEAGGGEGRLGWRHRGTVAAATVGVRSGGGLLGRERGNAADGGDSFAHHLAQSGLVRLRFGSYASDNVNSG